MRALLALLLIAAAVPGDAAENEVVVRLRAMAPSDEARLGYSAPRALSVEHTRPRFLFKTPEFTAEEPLYFRLALGQTEGVPFFCAIDTSLASGVHDRLWIDRNRDLDLTNDGEPVKANIRTLWTTEGKLVEFLGVRLELPYRRDGQETLEPYDCVVFYMLGRGEGTPKRIVVERDGWREGQVDLGGARYTVVVIDDDSDGQFSTSDFWTLKPASTDGQDLLARDATRTMLRRSWTADQKLTVDVKAIDADGGRVTLVVAPAEESEREYFARIARQRQTDEERRLNIDPLRPKAAEGDAVDWIEGEDVDYALKEIAQSAQVRKPVLLDFTGKACPWCRLMETYTFRDREVVSLAKQFVCAKIQFTANAGDTLKQGVQGTPTYVILGVEGNEIARHAGFMRPTAFAAWLKAALR